MLMEKKLAKAEESRDDHLRTIKTGWKEHVQGKNEGEITTPLSK
jgi:hypothetical protein